MREYPGFWGHEDSNWYWNIAWLCASKHHQYPFWYPTNFSHVWPFLLPLRHIRKILGKARLFNSKFQCFHPHYIRGYFLYVKDWRLGWGDAAGKEIWDTEKLTAWSKITELPCGWQGLGALAWCQAWASEVGEPSSGHWTTRDCPALCNVNQRELSQRSPPQC